MEASACDWCPTHREWRPCVECERDEMIEGLRQAREVLAAKLERAERDGDALRSMLDAEIAQHAETNAKLAKYRDAVQHLINRRDDRDRLRDDVTSDDSHLAGVRHALTVFCDAFDRGGVSAGRLAELLGHGISYLHSAGLQAVANHITEAAEASTAHDALRDALRAYSITRRAEDDARERCMAFDRLGVDRNAADYTAARVTYRAAIDAAISAHDELNRLADAIATEEP